MTTMTTVTRRLLPVTTSIALLGVLALGAGGCAGRSAQPRFYVLTGASRAAVTPAATPGPAPTIGLGPVTLPAYLERTNIVTRRGAEVEVAELDRWGEPLGEGVPRALAAHLGALLHTESIVVFPWSAGTPIERQVVVNVTRFDGTVGGEVLLEARWRVLDPDKKELLLRASVVRQKASEPGYLGVVTAMSRSLAALSEEIAQSMRGLPARQAGVTPAGR